jgi:hypothetical protein
LGLARLDGSSDAQVPLGYIRTAISRSASLNLRSMWTAEGRCCRGRAPPPAPDPGTNAGAADDDDDVAAAAPTVGLPLAWLL